jgi:hypothetical protein
MGMADSDSVVSAREKGAWIGALLLTAAGFVLLVLLVQRAPATMSSAPWLTMWLELATLSLAGALLLSWLLLRRTPIKLTSAIGLVSLFLSFLVLAALQPTPYTLDGISGDQGLYTAYVTKFATYAGNVDAIYGDLPAFYPPLYFYLLGRAADWLTLEPFRLLKMGLLTTTLLLPFALAWIWRRLVDLPYAAAAAFVLLLEPQWYKPAEWLTMVLFVPWWLHWVENVHGHRPQSRAAQWRWWLVGGLIGALIFQSYYYWFFVGGLSLLGQVGWGLVRPTGRAAVRKLLTNALPMLASSAILSVLYWGPYLYSMARSGGWHVLQNRWIAEGKLPLPLPFAEATPVALLLLLGLLYLAATATTSPVVRSLLCFLVAVYGWLAVGYAGMLADLPLLTFRAYPLATYLPALGLAFGLAHLWQGPWPAIGSTTSRTLVRVTATCAVVVVLLLAQTAVVAWLKNEDVPKAVTLTYPDAQLAALDAAMTDGYRDKTILLSRDYVAAIAYRPFFAFLAWSAHYSHPAAHFYDRLDLLEGLTTVHSPALFAAALFDNRYAYLDGLLLRPVDGGWTLTFLDDNYPNRNVQRTLIFAADNLAAPYFAATTAGEWTLLTPQPDAEPLPPLTLQAMADASAAQVALSYALLQRFGRHLDLPDQAALQIAVQQRLATASLAEVPLATLADLYQVAAPPLRDQVYAALVANLPHAHQQLLTDQIGAEKVRLLGVAQEAAAGEQPAQLVIYLEVLAQPDWDYSLWLHAERAGETVNLDFAPLWPTSTWQPGQIVRLTRPLPLAAGTYALTFGFWRSAEDVRLVQPSGEVGVALGEVTIP